MLFLQGRWDTLLSEASPPGAADALDDDAGAPPSQPLQAGFYPVRKSPAPPREPDPSPLMDEADRKAAKSQYALTALGSIRAASAALFAPPDLPPAAPGAR